MKAFKSVHGIEKGMAVARTACTLMRSTSHSKNCMRYKKRTVATSSVDLLSSASAPKSSLKRGPRSSE